MITKLFLELKKLFAELASTLILGKTRTQHILRWYCPKKAGL